MDGSDHSDWFRDWEVLGFEIEVQLVEDASARAVHEVWIAELLAFDHSAEVDFGTIAELTEALAVEPNGFAPPPYLVDYKRNFTSWGASGASQSVLLQVASTLAGSGIIAVYGNAVYDSLKSAVVRLTAKAARRADWDRDPLTREEAIERARWHLIFRFDLLTDERNERASLVLAGEEERLDGSRMVRFRDGERLYEVEFVDEAGLVTIGRTMWTERDGGSSP